MAAETRAPRPSRRTTRGRPSRAEYDSLGDEKRARKGRSRTMKIRGFDRARRGGFSLLELMLVLAIIGVLTAVAAVSVFGQGEKAKKKATRASMAVIKNALDQYHLEKSVWPTTLSALQAGNTP